MCVHALCTSLVSGMYQCFCCIGATLVLIKRVCADYIVPTCTMLEISVGNMERGKRMMLKRERATKALSAVKASPEARTKVVNVARATYRERGG